MSERRQQRATSSAAPNAAAVPFPVPVVGLAWHARSACLRAVIAGDLPADTWDDHVDRERPAERRLRHERAGTVCAACPVAEACLTDHLAGYGGGFRAGYAFEDLSDHRPDNGRAGTGGRPRGDADCGTPRGARAHRYRGEDACPPCADAERAENRERMRLRREEARALRELELVEVPA